MKNHVAPPFYFKKGDAKHQGGNVTCPGVHSRSQTLPTGTSDFLTAPHFLTPI